jgi:magnesium transporter
MSRENKVPLVESVQALNAVDAASLLGTQPHEVIREVLSALPEERALSIASHLPGSISPEGADTVALVSDLDLNIGEIMSPPIGTLSPDTTVAGAIDNLVHRKSVTEVTYFYVVTATGVLQGTVTLRDLLLSKPGQVLSEVMTVDPFSFSPETPLSEAVQAALSKHHRLYPVTDVRGFFRALFTAGNCLKVLPARSMPRQVPWWAWIKRNVSVRRSCSLFGCDIPGYRSTCSPLLPPLL